MALCSSITTPCRFVVVGFIGELGSVGRDHGYPFCQIGNVNRHNAGLGKASLSPPPVPPEPGHRWPRIAALRTSGPTFERRPLLSSATHKITGSPPCRRNCFSACGSDIQRRTTADSFTSAQQHAINKTVLNIRRSFPYLPMRQVDGWPTESATGTGTRRARSRRGARPPTQWRGRRETALPLAVGSAAAAGRQPPHRYRFSIAARSRGDMADGPAHS